MTFKASIAIEVVKNDRLYTFLVPNGSPYEDIHEVMGEMKEALIQKAQEVAQEEQPV
jgi:hypothetical protein